MKKTLVSLVVVLAVSSVALGGGWGCWSPPQEQAQGVSIGQGAVNCGIGYAASSGTVGGGGIQCQGSQAQGQVVGATESSVRCGIGGQMQGQNADVCQEQVKSRKATQQYQEAGLCNEQSQGGLGMAGQQQVSGYGQGQLQPGQGQGQIGVATQCQTMVGAGTQAQGQSAGGCQMQSKN